MAVRIHANSMTLEIDDRVVATARFSQHAAADGNDAWIVPTHPARLLTRNQANTDLTLAVHPDAGYGDNDPFVTNVPVTSQLIRITTALAVVAVASVAGAMLHSRMKSTR